MKPIVLIHDQRKTLKYLVVAVIVTMAVVSFLLWNVWDEYDFKQDMKSHQMERLGIARQNRVDFLARKRAEEVQDSIDRHQKDSILAIETKIRAGWVEDLKRKGLWKDGVP